MPEQFTQAEFVISLREKYPVYNDIDDSTLVANVVEKYPIYKDQISDFGAPIEKKLPEEKNFAQKALGFLKEKFTFTPEQEAKFGELVEGFGLPAEVKQIQERLGREGFLDIFTDELRKELEDKPVASSFLTGLLGEYAQIGQELPEAKTIGEKVARGAAGLAGTVISFAPVAKATKAIGIGSRIARKHGLIGRLIGSAETFIAHGQLLSKSTDYEKRLEMAGEDLTTGLAFGIVGGLGKDYLKGITGKLASYPSMFGLGFGMSKMGDSSNEDAIINGVLLVALHGIHDIGGKKADTRASREFLTKKLKSEGIEKPEGLIEKAFERAEEFKKNNPETYEALTTEPGFKIDKSVIFEEKPSVEPIKAEKVEEAVVTPKEAEITAEAKIAQEKVITEPTPDVTTRKATYTVQEDGKIIKKAKGVETEVTQDEYNEVLEQQQRNKKLAQAHILEKEKGIVDEEAKKIKQDMFGVESLLTLSSGDVVKYIDVLKEKKVKEIPIKEITTEKKQKLVESIQKKHGQTELRIAELKKKGLTDKDIDSVVLEDGTKFSETVKVKREKTGVLSAVITKDDIKEVKSSYTKEKPVDKWRTKKPFVDKLTVGKEEAKRLYELPQVIFETSGLKKILYDPVVKAERGARDLKTEIYNRFQKANLLKPGNAILPDRFLLSKKEKVDIGKYYLDRQGKKTGVTFEKLSTRSKKFVKMFDQIIKESEEKFFEVAKKNGLEPEKVENYAPLLTKNDIELAEDIGLMDFITRKHPAFFSTKERAEKVPIELYEKDYAKVATVWIDKMADFIYLGEVMPKIKYLTDSKEFSDIVTAWDKKYIDTWVHDITTPRIEKPLLKEYAKPLRKAASIAALGANIIPVVKQSLTQIPLTFVEKAPPRLRSRFAKDFGVSVKDLPSIKQRKGNVAIQDMQEGFARVVVGSLTEFDKYNARLSLNSLLDKSYKKYKKEGLPIDEKVQKLIIKEAQDKLDLWYGGMTKAQMPEAFRSEAGKLLNMFIYPLTSQLNGFYLQIAKARGFGSKSKAIAEVLSAATAIAYAEQALTKMTFKWRDVEEMSKDIVESLAGNIPVLGSIVFALANEQPYSPSPIINSVTNLFKKLNKVVDEPTSVDELLFAFAEMFGLPKQVRRTYEGIQFAKEEGFRDKKGKLLAPALKGDRLRAVIRGKYGTLAVQEYLDNLGEKTENRKWTYPEVEFLQSGDYDRKAVIYKKLDPKTKRFLYNELSEAQKKKLRDHL